MEATTNTQPVHKVATFIKRLNITRAKEHFGLNNTKALYLLTPPFEDHLSRFKDPIQYVVISASYMLDKHNYAVIWETFAFQANKHGVFDTSMELDGSESVTLDHERVLSNMGYDLVIYPPGARYLMEIER